MHLAFSGVKDDEERMNVKNTDKDNFQDIFFVFRKDEWGRGQRLGGSFNFNFQTYDRF